MRDDERLIECYIPDNYKTGITFLSLNFKPRFLFEGIILGTIFGIGAYFLFSYMGIQIGTAIGLTIAVAASGLLLGIKGLNDEPISKFIGLFFKYRNRRRTAYYNPRVKSEIIPFYQEPGKELAVDKIIALYIKYKDMFDKNSQKRTMENQINKQFDEDHMYFQDDIGVVDKPLEYMTDKEYKAHKKMEKKLKKQMDKQNKGRRKLD